MKHINYIDCGLYDGDEIEMFTTVMQNLKISTSRFTINAFEAHPEYCKNISRRFADQSNIFIHNYAISDSIGSIRLYLQKNGGGEGNSIFATKRNVDEYSYFDVQSISLIDFIVENIPNFNTSINILRCNIEGAELPLFEDLISKDFSSKFLLYLGSEPGVDLKKTKQLEDKYHYFVNMLSQNKIKIKRFCSATLGKNIDLEREIKFLIS
jgi:FkbM family methyltransferase